MSPFNLNHSIALWRRSRESNRAFTADDLDELEQHLRDQVGGLIKDGLTEEEAFRTALAEMGDYGTAETEYKKTYWGKVVHRHGLLKELSFRKDMIKNYFKIALRNLIRQKGYVAINLAGLAVGLASAILLFLLLHFEWSFDRFHERADRIFILGEQLSGKGMEDRHFYLTRTPTLPALLQEEPDAESGTRYFSNSRWVSPEKTREVPADLKSEEEVAYVDSSFFDVFSFRVVQGNGKLVLASPGTVLITESLALRFFGEENPVGKTLNLDFGKATATIGGVLEDAPLNSTIRPSIVTGWVNAPDYLRPENDGNWYNSNMTVYVRIRDGVRESEFLSRLQAFKDRHFTPYPGIAVHMVMLPFVDYHAETTDSNKMITLLGIIAVFTLLIATINYVNLSTARSLGRAREIGVRKVMGAYRAQLTGQFLGESALMCFLALVLAFGIVGLMLPLFNRYFEYSLSLSLYSGGVLLAALLIIGLLTSLFAGIYPALFLSRFDSSLTMRGQLKQGPGSTRLRQSLVVLQFALSIALIAGTFVVWSQIGYMKGQNLHFNRENVVVVEKTWSGFFADSEAAQARLEAIRNELQAETRIQSVTFSDVAPGHYWYNYNTFSVEGRGHDAPVRMRQASVGAGYFETYGIPVVAGRTFSADRSTEEGSVILNETAARAAGWTPEEAVGKTLQDGRFTVVGVVHDFFYQSLENEMEPLIHFYASVPSGYLSVRIAPKQATDVMDVLRAKWKTLPPGPDFTYFFMDEEFDRLYRAQERFGLAGGFFSIVSIVIACLGLFGLAAFTAEQRTKEIGIRKAMGATIPDIVALLSRSFLILVGIAFFVSAPIAYFIMRRWLEGFAFRMDLSPWLFLPVGLVVVLIAFLTVSYQSIKAALADPVRSLRHE